MCREMLASLKNCLSRISYRFSFEINIITGQIFTNMWINLRSGFYIVEDILHITLSRAGSKNVALCKPYRRIFVSSVLLGLLVLGVLTKKVRHSLTNSQVNRTPQNYINEFTV